MHPFFGAYALTLIIETGVLLLLLRRRYGARTIILNSMIANTATLPFVWFFFPLLGLGWTIQTTMAELFAFGAEAVIYRFAFAKIGWKDALLVSLAANLLSFGTGLLLM